MKRDTTSMLKNTILIAVSFCFSLGIAEVGIRIFRPQKLYRFPRNMFIADPLLSFRPAPGFEGIMRNPEYKTHIKINSKGLRDKEYKPKGPDVYRILALGDSFTMGNNVELEQTYPKVLEQILNKNGKRRQFEVINAGVAGYGTEHELNFLRKYGPSYHPDLVLLAFYVGNDVQNNLRYPENTVRNGYLVTTNTSRGILPIRVRHFLARHSHLYLFFWDKYNNALIRLGLRPKPTPPHFIDILSKEYTPELRNGWERTFKLLSEMAKVSQLLGARIAIIVIPSRFQVYDHLWKKALTKWDLNTENYNPQKPARILLEFGKENNVPVLDLLPSFRVEGQKNVFYHSLDGHCNQAGNALAAREIYNFLVIHSLLSKSK